MKRITVKQASELLQDIATREHFICDFQPI